MTTPSRLWALIHDNCWETWIADREDGTYAAWICGPGEDGANGCVEDTFGLAVAASLTRLNALTGHDRCTGACGVWTERQPPPRTARSRRTREAPRYADLDQANDWSETRGELDRSAEQQRI